MPYVKNTWANGVAPALNETNLNHMEDGIEAAMTAAENSVFANLDGGDPSENFGGIDPIDGGVA